MFDTFTFTKKSCGLLLEENGCHAYPATNANKVLNDLVGCIFLDREDNAPTDMATDGKEYATETFA